MPFLPSFPVKHTFLFFFFGNSSTYFVITTPFMKHALYPFVCVCVCVCVQKMIFSKKNEERKEERKMVLSLSLHTHTNKQTNTTFTRSLVKTHILRCENVEEGLFRQKKKRKGKFIHFSK